MAAPLRTDYARAGIERLSDSRLLIENQAYGGAIYYSGLAAESMIKAFIVGKGDEIKGHNLANLAKAANFARRLRAQTRIEVDAAILEATPMWRNLFRYSSTVELERMALEFRIRFEIQGKMVPYAELGPDGIRLWSERLYNLSSLIVQEGNLLWQSKKP
jgi:HEPN domain-containing protein